jgi:phage baseplate assembly protein W
MASISFDLDFASFEEDQTFKYKDIELPIFKQDSEFDVDAIYDAVAVLNSLRNIFQWKQGERILNQEFGNPILPYIYEGITNNTANKISTAIRESVQKWEPRVTINEVNVIPNEDQNEIRVSITYSIPSLDQTNLNFDLNINI